MSGRRTRDAVTKVSVFCMFRKYIMWNIVDFCILHNVNSFVSSNVSSEFQVIVLR